MDTLAPGIKLEVKLAKKIEYLYNIINISIGYIETSPCSKPPATHKYVKLTSFHDRKLISAIPYSIL